MSFCFYTEKQAAKCVLLLVQKQVGLYGYSYGSTHHWVVAHAQIAHHLNVSRYRRRTCELSVAVHTTHGVGHTIRSRTCSHVVRVQRTARTTTGSNREVRLASGYALLLICTGNWVLETCRVGGVTSDGDIHILVPEDGNAFADIVSAIALYLQTGRIVTVRNLLDNVQLACVVVKLSLDVCEAIDTADDLCGVFAQTVQNHAQRFFTYFVCHLSNLDGTLSSCERLVAGQEGEALGLFTEQTGCQITMTQTYLTVVSHTSGDAESLQTDTDGLGALSSTLAALLDSDSSTGNVSPFCILKADALCVLANLIRIDAQLVANFVCLFEVLDAIGLEGSVDLCLTTLPGFRIELF